VAKYEKGVYYLGIKVFNMVHSYIKTEFDNPKKFKVVLEKLLHESSFYSLDEYFELQKSLIFKYDLDRYMEVLACMFVFLMYQSVSYICLYMYLDEGSNHYL
jgi:hypothetical protein